jgi:hypothetical protein
VILRLKISTLDFFYGFGFLRPLSPNEIESNIPNDHVSGANGDKTLITVVIDAPITRANARM